MLASHAAERGVQRGSAPLAPRARAQLAASLPPRHAPLPPRRRTPHASSPRRATSAGTPSLI
jgi:hypothetical protein